MKVSEVRERTDEELVTLCRQLEEDLYKLRVQKATNQLEDTNAPRRVHKDLARVRTIINARMLGNEESKKEAAE